jgi:adenylyl-sulfate kinase
MNWAVWLTGPPASGKSTIARALRDELAGRGVEVIVLESDALRRELTPEPTYEPEERDRFYRAVAGLAALLAEQGIPVIVDATAPRRAQRDRLRARLSNFLEIEVATPLEICEQRDPKGLYRRAREGHAPHLPGATEAYEAPLAPDLVLSGTDSPAGNARAICRLVEKRFGKREIDLTAS